MKVRVGSRGSALAVAQSRIITDAITAAYPDIETEIVVIKTTGDVNMKPFADVSDPAGIKGLFTLELEQALLNGSIDIAVHSLKDVPTELDERLPIVAYSERGDPRDAIVLPANGENDGMPIGCSSLRRRIQLASLFPGRAVEPVRGNISTRLRKLDEGQFSMLVLAAAGLKRLGMEDRISRILSADEMLPAPGQGILACQGRAGEDYFYLDAVRSAESEDCAAAERAFASALGTGCLLPAAAYAVVNGGEITLRALYMPSGHKEWRSSLTGPRECAASIGRQLAETALRDIQERM